MRMGVCAGAAALSLVAPPVARADAPSCGPVEVAWDPPSSELPEVTARLRAETAQPGRPWSCPTGKLWISAEGGRFSVALDRGRDAAPVVRQVSTSEEIVPLSLALLARPAPEATPPASAPAPPSPAPTAPPSVDLAAPDATPEVPAGRERGVLLGALLEARVVAPSEVVTLGPRLEGGGKVDEDGRWSLGGFAHLGAPIADFRRGPELLLVEAGVRLGPGTELGPVELRGDAEVGAVAVVRDRKRPEPTATSVLPAVGLRVGISGPPAERLRWAVSVGGQLTPHAGEEEAPGDNIAPLPWVSVGLAAGAVWAP